MTTFDTPGPISVDIQIRVGNVRLLASERADTVVQVRPSSPDDRSDVQAAEQTLVELLGERLSVHGPPQGLLARLLTSASVEVSIALPVGSALSARIGLGDVRAEGRLGECQVATGAGHVLLGDVGALAVRTGSGDVVAGSVAGDATVDTDQGATQIAAVLGAASIRNGHGSPKVGPVGGDLRVRCGHGDIVVESVDGRVDARTAHGAVRIGRLSGPEAEARTAHGDIVIGIAEGRTAWLDLATGDGRIEKDLLPADAPDEDGATIRLTARTPTGDIRVLRVPEAP